MAGLNKPRESLARASDLVAAHRARNVKNDTDRHRRIVVTEKRNVLRQLFVENREGAFVQARNVAAIRVSNGDG